jgi:hypothetical protein
MSTNLDGSGVTAVAELARSAATATERVINIEGTHYSTAPLVHLPVMKAPEPSALTVQTLSGFADYVNGNRDELDLGSCVVHVVSPRRVELRSRLTGHAQQRFLYLRAEMSDRFAALGQFAFGKYLPAETMKIALLALFVPASDSQAANDLGTVLGLVGRVRAVNESEQADDGFTQHVTAKAGVHLVNTLPTAVPSRVELRPFRTFAEVPQPPSPYILRFKDAGDQGVLVALFEADGGAWENTAIEHVRDYLRQAIPTDVQVLA